MIRQTRLAGAQTTALLDHYLRKERYEAYSRLLAALQEAAARIEADPAGGVSHPTSYPGIARWGFHWIKVHRYWFGWSTARGYPLITNVLFDTSNLSARVAPEEDDEEPF